MRPSNHNNHHHLQSSDSHQSDYSNSQPEKYPSSQPHLHGHKPQQPMYSDSDSLSEDDSSLESPTKLAKRYGLNNNIDRAEESHENSDKSIDQIEERIKNLQKDLEERIGKHRQQKAKEKKDPEKIRSIKNTTSPIPKRPETAGVSTRKLDAMQPIKNQLHSKLKPIYEAQFEKANKSSTRVKNLQQNSKVDSTKMLRDYQQIDQPKLSNMKVNQKPRVDSKNLRHQSTRGYHVQQLSKANKQIEELHKVIDDLKTENRRLKDQLNQRRNKKPALEVEKLQQLAGQGNAKLEKQLQLLKIIQVLQGKLKRSINSKLKKGGASTSSALLHKGLPASLLN